MHKGCHLSLVHLLLTSNGQGGSRSGPHTRSWAACAEAARPSRPATRAARAPHCPASCRDMLRPHTLTMSGKPSSYILSRSQYDSPVHADLCCSNIWCASWCISAAPQKCHESDCSAVWLVDQSGGCGSCCPHPRPLQVEMWAENRQEGSCCSADLSTKQQIPACCCPAWLQP